MIQLRVILFEDADLWLAQGLEHDICVQATTKGEAMALFDLTVELEDSEEGGITQIPPAPRDFFDRWESWSETHRRYSYRDDLEYEFRRVL